MYTFLLVLLIIDSIVLVLAILAQSGKGGGLAASFGGMSSSADSLLGMRQAGNLFTQISWWGGGLFLALAFILALLSTRSRVPASVLDRSFNQPPVTTPAPSQSAPAVPLQPAPATPGQAPASRPPTPPQ
jgi:preprotein translocase subunit SecG